MKKENYKKNGKLRNQGIFNAFTLVELLVVLAIVATLLSLLIPMIQRNIEAANRTKCASNLKTLSSAVLNYTYENNGYLPFSVDADSKPWFWSVGAYTEMNYSQEQYINWRDNLIKRGMTKILYCPSAVLENIQAPFDVSYGINSTLCYAYNPSQPNRAPRKPINIPKHSEVILVMDGKSYSERQGSAWRVTSRDGISSRHKKGANIGWLDGHVTWESNERLNNELTDNKYWLP